MRLRRLRKLEEMELRSERDDADRGARGARQAARNRRRASARGSSGTSTALRERYGQDTALGRRRTLIAEAAPALEIPLDAMIEKEPVTVILSQRGWIRAVRGHVDRSSRSLKFKEGDGARFFFHAQTTDKLLLAADDGRFFTLGADKLPGARGFGEPVKLMLDIEGEGNIVALILRKPRPTAAARHRRTAAASSPRRRARSPRPARAGRWSTSGPARSWRSVRPIGAGARSCRGGRREPQAGGVPLRSCPRWAAARASRCSATATAGSPTRPPSARRGPVLGDGRRERPHPHRDRHEAVEVARGAAGRMPPQGLPAGQPFGESTVSPATAMHALAQRLIDMAAGDRLARAAAVRRKAGLGPFALDRLQRRATSGPASSPMAIRSPPLTGKARPLPAGQRRGRARLAVRAGCGRPPPRRRSDRRASRAPRHRRPRAGRRDQPLGRRLDSRSRAATAAAISGRPEASGEPPHGSRRRCRPPLRAATSAREPLDARRLDLGQHRPEDAALDHQRARSAPDRAGRAASAARRRSARATAPSGRWRAPRRPRAPPRRARPRRSGRGSGRSAGSADGPRRCAAAGRR